MWWMMLLACGGPVEVGHADTVRVMEQLADCETAEYPGVYIQGLETTTFTVQTCSPTRACVGPMPYRLDSGDVLTVPNACASDETVLVRWVDTGENEPIMLR